VIVLSENEEFNANDGGALRKQLEKALAEQKEMAEKLKAYEARERMSSVGDVLAKKGFNSKLARFVPDEVGADEAKIDAWLKDNADVFTPQAGTEGESGDQVPGGEPNAPQGAAEAFNRIEAVNASGKAATVDLDSVMAKIKAAKDPAELDALLAQYKLS
jgi:hypothetical protein